MCVQQNGCKNFDDNIVYVISQHDGILHPLFYPNCKKAFSSS